MKSEEEDGGIPKIEAVYQRRKKPDKSSEPVNLGWLVKGARTSSINGLKRDSWARSLSTRYLGVAVMHVPCFAKICGLRFDHKAEESLAAASQLVIVLVCPNSIFIFYLLRFLFTRA